MSNFFLRTITGILFVAVILGSLFIGEIGFALLFLVIIFGTMNEFYSLLSSNGYPTFKITGLTTGLLLFILIFLDKSLTLNVKYGILVVAYLLIPVSMVFKKPNNMLLVRFSSTILGIVYIALPLSLSLFIVYLTGEYEPWILLSLFVLLWANDTFAYLSGLAFGKTKLIERISPKKTLEGLFGGGLFTMLISVFINKWIPAELSLFDWLSIAFLIVAAGNIGDLTESVIKRSLNVKDSGRAFPGHGGFLDRFDSILLALPSVFAYLYIFKH